MEIWIFWKMDTELICFRLRHLQWKYIKMIRVHAFEMKGTSNYNALEKELWTEDA